MLATHPVNPNVGYTSSKQTNPNPNIGIMHWSDISFALHRYHKRRSSPSKQNRVAEGICKHSALSVSTYCILYPCGGVARMCEQQTKNFCAVTLIRSAPVDTCREYTYTHSVQSASVTGTQGPRVQRIVSATFPDQR